MYVSFYNCVVYADKHIYYEFFRKIGKNINTHIMLIHLAAVLYIDTEKLHDVDTSVMV